MNNEEYFEEMERVSGLTEKITRDALDRYEKRLSQNDSDYGFSAFSISESRLSEIISELPKKRMETSQNRTYFAAKTYSALSRTDVKDDLWIPLAAAIDMELCSMYYFNRVCDDKGEKRDKPEIIQQEIASLTTQSLAGQILIDNYQGKIPDRTLIELMSFMNISAQTFVAGQHFDVFENVLELTNNPTQMTDSCNRRIYGINASFYEKIALMAAGIASTKREIPQAEIDAVKSFGFNYGYMLQIVNDIADYVPARFDLSTAEKNPEDAYADIKHGKRTYPIIYTWDIGESEDIDLIQKIREEGLDSSPQDLERLTKTMLGNKSIHYAKLQAKEYARKAVKSLKKFPKELSTPLTIMCGMAYENKYYYMLAKFASEQKQPQGE